MRRLRPRTNASKRGLKDRFTQDQVIAALRAGGGSDFTLLELGCSPSTITNYIERHDEVAQAEEQITEECLNIGETIVIKRLARDDTPSLQFRAAKYYLAKKGHDREFTTRKTKGKSLDDKYDLTRLATHSSCAPSQGKEVLKEQVTDRRALAQIGYA